MKKIIRFSIFILTFLFIHSIAKAQGQLWGMSRVGGAGAGVIFKTNADGSNYVAVQKKWTPEVKGTQPTTGLTLASNGKFYGITNYGGESNKGTLFEFTPVGAAYTTLHEFKITEGYSPAGGVMQASNGKLYGIATQNPNYKAVLYEYDLATGTYIERYTFATGVSGGSGSGLMQASNGKIYGSTGSVLFEIDLTNFTYTEKITLNNQTGYNTSGRLVQASNGKLYGAQSFGGANNSGTVFEYDIATNTYTVKFDFLEKNGGIPLGHMIKASNGKLYGITQGSGYPRQTSPDYGTIYEFDPASGILSVKKDFASDFAIGSSAAFSALEEASNGKLYGLSNSNGLSAIFEFDPASGNSYLDLNISLGLGFGKYGWMTLGQDNLLYGVMAGGGVTGNGTIFSYNTSVNSYSRKIDLGYASEGGYPMGGLVQAANNKLYGMTSSGGTNKVGVLFEIDPTTGSYVNKYSFDGLNGATPLGGLTAATNGKLYGMTTFGGNVSTSDEIFLKVSNIGQYLPGSGYGVIFEFDPTTSTYTKLFNLGLATGSNPYGNLMQASNGKFYGMTSSGGTNSRGVLFEYDLNGTYTVKHHFESTASNFIEKKGPKGSLVEVNGKLYGLTATGGSNIGGTVFEFDLTSGVFTTKADFSAPTDVSPTSLGAVPNGTLTLASNGKLYGITSQGGEGFASYLAGVLFEYDIASSTIIRKIALPNVIGGSSMSSLTAAPNGKLYGTTLTADGNPGSVFEYNPATNLLASKFYFKGDNGAEPYYGSLLFVSGKMEQTIPFTAPDTKQLAASTVTFTLPATSSAGLPVSYASSDPTVASVSGITVTLLKAGTTTLTATQAGNTDYNAAADVAQLLTVVKGNQTITFNAIPDRKISEGNLSLVANVSSGLTITYTSSDPNVATIVGGTAVMHDIGTTTITASQEGNNTFNAAVPVSKTLTVTKGDQTITFIAFPNVTTNTSAFVINATASSGLPLTFTSSNTAIATVTGDQITIVAAGTTDIKAAQAGNANYNAAADVTRTLTVAPGKSDQTITFATISSKTLGGAAFTLGATASSGLAVQYSTTSDKVTLAGNQVTMVKAGSVTISADQAGDATHNAAPRVNQTFCINPAKPTVTLTGADTENILLNSSAAAGNQWFLNGTAIPAATSTTLKPAGAGIYKVQVTVESCVSAFSNDQSLIITGDIREVGGNEIQLYPNPVKERLLISLPNRTTPISTVHIMRMDGAAMETLTSSEATLEVNVAHYSTGIYLMKINHNGVIQFKKFIKQ